MTNSTKMTFFLCGFMNVKKSIKKLEVKVSEAAAKNKEKKDPNESKGILHEYITNM